MFAELEAFVAAHRPCGDFDPEVGEPTTTGYALEVRCACGAAFARWISPELAAEGLLRSRLSVVDN